MSQQELLVAARSAVALAKKHGAKDAAASASRSREVETTWRDGKIEKVSDAVSRSVTLQIYADGKYGSMSTSDLRPDALDRFVAGAVQMVRAIAPDAHRTLPDPSHYEGRSTEDLGAFDPALLEVTADARVARAKALEEAARSVKDGGRILSVSTAVSDQTVASARVTTNGFEGAFQASYASQSASVSVKDDDGRRPEDWAYATTRKLSSLPPPELVGREATERALTRLGAKKMPSGTMNVLVEARAARGLLWHLVGPLSGASLQQRESFLEGKLGSAVASRELSLTDDPLLREGLASRPYDSEGISTKRRALFEKGVLKTYLLDVYYANKLKLTPNSGATTNVLVAPGTRSKDQLTADMKDGIVITSFLGGNSNGTTGVFSLGLAGYRVVAGKRAEAVGEMNISGNHLDFWKRLVAVGNDPYLYSSLRSPSLLFEKVSVAGT